MKGTHTLCVEIGKFNALADKQVYCVLHPQKYVLYSLFYELWYYRHYTFLVEEKLSKNNLLSNKHNKNY